MRFRKKGCWRVSLSCVYGFNKSLKEFDKINRPCLIIWDDFDGVLSYLELWERQLGFWAYHSFIFELYMIKLPCLPLDLFGLMMLELLGGKCIIKFEGPVVTIYIFFHLKCLTCVLTEIWLEQRKALILTLSVWNRHCSSL